MKRTRDNYFGQLPVISLQRGTGKLISQVKVIPIYTEFKYHQEIA